MVTYSDDYDTLDIHGWNYYLMDDTLFIIYALSMVSGMAMICIDCSPIFSLPEICRLLTGRRLCWNLMANPFLWMTAARCANAAAGMFTGGQMT